MPTCTCESDLDGPADGSLWFDRMLAGVELGLLEANTPSSFIYRGEH